ncbi:MAG: HAD-IC family P-type ATPase [Candidatus Buchananbacteria bacterium]|nr:HAD-IC family P-type ATPase [Candidatus Buchananbacteria bacterium]
METFKYTAKSSKEIVKEFNSDSSRGLSSKKAKELLLKYGHNILSKSELQWWKILARQFKSAFIYLLIIASVISIGLREFIEGAMIIIFLLINAGLGFFQEYRSEKTVKLLKKYIISYVRVWRDNKKIIIKSEELVPGDIIFLETGDKIPADVRFLETENLIVDESVLTGESMPVNKISDTLKNEAGAHYQALNLGFSGTAVLKGEAKAIVIASGFKTAMGKIAKLSTETKRTSDFEKGIAKFSSFILKLIIVTLIIVFLANILIKGHGLNIIELIIFSIALTVSVIPEALPVVTTFALSSGAMALAKKKIIVKRLSAVEDLGGIEVLCTDKTGTLTQNKLAVTDIYAPNGKSDDVLFFANLASSFDQTKKLEPFDIALCDKLDKASQKEVCSYTISKECPFDPNIRRNITLVSKKSNQTLITRGATESILPLCKNIPAQEIKNIKNWLIKEGELGHRTMAVAYKTGAKIKNNLEQENDFDFLGIVSFSDSIKQSAYQIAKQAKLLGVKIKIITGDSPEVAGAVAYKIGLISSPQEVITAEQWEKLKPQKKREALEKYSVFARVSPEQKYAVIEALQVDHTVGFLGEGINDAPVLKIAGVSLVVDSASDIAKESADILLLQKDLKVILDGIEEGRKIFANTAKYIKATLISNFGNFFAISVASLLIDFLPMFPLQILLVNLLSDFPMIAIATDSVDKNELKSPKKYEIKDIVILSITLGFLSTVFDFIFFALFYKISPGVLQTNWFIGSILTELVLIFSIRTKFSFLKAKRPSAVLSILSIVAILATVIIPFTYLGQHLFMFIRPSLNHLVIIFGLVIAYFISTEALKLIFFKKLNGNLLEKTSPA